MPERRKASRSPQRMRVGTWTIESGNLPRYRKAARYQFIMAVSAPGCDQAERYSARSSAENVPERLELRSALLPKRKSKAEKTSSGSNGSWRRNMYQLRRIWRRLDLR